MTVYPAFYNDFCCKAAACGHTCCAGWEIDVDDRTLLRYRETPGPIGDKLRKCIAVTGDGAGFVLTEDNRCPFLQDDGLCELILTLGENALCDICREHPRFYAEFDDVLLTGQGLSCEAAAELLLKAPAPLPFVFDDGKTRKAASFAGVCRALGITLPEGADRYDSPQGEALLTQYADVFGTLETMDPAWSGALEAALGTDAPGTLTGGALQNVYTYLFYRQLEKAEEYGAEVLRRFAALNTALIRRLTATGLTPVKALTSWSEEIEYSTENADVLLEAMG